MVSTKKYLNVMLLVFLCFHLFYLACEDSSRMTVDIPPITSFDSFTVCQGVSSNIFDVLANDSPGTFPINPSTVAIVTFPNQGGTVSTLANGNIKYTPDPSFSGVEIFEYTVNDTIGLTSQPTLVAVTVTPAPIPSPNTFNICENTRDNVLDILSNDSANGGAPIDPGETLLFSTAPFPSFDFTLIILPNGDKEYTLSTNGGVVVITTAGEVLYTPDTNFTGVETFNYRIRNTDGCASQVAAEVTLNVGGDPPIANPNTFNVVANSTNNVFNVLNNDIAGTSPLDVTSVMLTVTPDNNGIATPQVDGTILYTPFMDFVGTETFAYKVFDTNTCQSSSAQVTVTVQEGGSCMATVGSDMSVEAFTTQQLVADGGRIARLALLTAGFALCGDASFDSRFQVIGPICFQGHRLTLNNDLVVHNNSEIVDMGDIVGNGHIFDLGRSVESLQSSVCTQTLI